METNNFLGAQQGEKNEEKEIETHTSIEQKALEMRIKPLYISFKNAQFLRYQHQHYLFKGIKKLSEGYQSLDASRPWICYWILHALNLLNADLPKDVVLRAIDFLSRCQNKNGGFGGGPVNALVSLGDEKALQIIDREKMYEFLMRVKDKTTGAFLMHEDGETDVRGTYCALSVASLLNIVTPELTEGAAEHIVRCQTYEGGIGGFPGNEAHGGYTFCALAALVILKQTDAIDLPRLLEWAVNRQMVFEGGFQGRTNKLVDACYSFWQGGIFPLIDSVLKHQPTSDILHFKTDGSWLFNQKPLQEYLLICCQDSDGGLKDKPAQHNRDDFDPATTVICDSQNLVEPTHPVYNIRPDRVEAAWNYFHSA